MPHKLKLVCKLYIEIYLRRQKLDTLRYVDKGNTNETNVQRKKRVFRERDGRSK